MDFPKSNDIKIKVKTMDNFTHAFVVARNLTVIQLKGEIEKRLKIKPGDQRLIFKAKVLEDYNTLEKYGIEESHTIHMVAKILPPKPLTQEDEKANETENENTESNPQNNRSENESQDIEIVNNILRTLGETSLNRRNERRRLLQQRTFGFPINARESLEIINQNLKTCSDLLITSQDKGVPFNNEKRNFKIGQWIDVKDTINQWLEAEVIDTDGDKVFVHYNGWGERWDEWIDMSSDRIAYFRTHTVQNAYGNYMSPCPQNTLDGNTDNLKKPTFVKENIVREFEGQIKRVMEMLRELHELQTPIDEEEFIDKQNIDIKKEKKYLNNKKKNPAKMDDNLSLKIEEKKSKVEEKKYDETVSMKSLRFKHAKSNIRTSRRVDISPNSLKTHTSNNSHFFNEGDMTEIIEEENYTFSSRFNRQKNQKLLNKIRQRDVAQKAQQLAPLFDRLGRAMIDLAPHIAMLGAEVSSISNLGQFRNLSTATMHGSTNMSNNRLGLFDRFNQQNESNTDTLQNNFGLNTQINPSMISNPIGQNDFSNTQQDSSNDLKGLTSDRPLLFQVPVMLNPGELLSIENNTGGLMGEGHVDLHINATVRGTPNVDRKDSGVQTDNEYTIDDSQFGKKKSEKDKYIIDEIEHDYNF